MRDLIQQIVQAELREYAEQFTRQEKDITELQRRLKNMNRVGSVLAVNESNDRIKVKFGDNKTPFIKWFSACAGDVAEYRLPSIGEQVVLINIGGGDNSSTSIALIGVSSDQFPLPTNNPDEILRVYPDGTRVLYDKKAHRLTVTVKGDTYVKSDGVAKVDAEQIIFNGENGEAYEVVTTGHPCQVTGLPHMCGSATVKAAK